MRRVFKKLFGTHKAVTPPNIVIPPALDELLATDTELRNASISYSLSNPHPQFSDYTMRIDGSFIQNGFVRRKFRLNIECCTITCTDGVWVEDPSLPYIVECIRTTIRNTPQWTY